MSARDELTQFVKKTLLDLGVSPEGGLTDDTSLLRSGLFDSMALLNLVAWVEAHVGTPLDPMQVDPIRHWDTMRDILNFCGQSATTSTGTHS